MTALVDIVNRSLAKIGTRTTITASDLTNNANNEAIQANIVLLPRRDETLRMAPWNCGSNYINMSLITAVPGTPENQSGSVTTWQKGLPAPPWAYEYQYPVDCLRPLFIVPQFTTGFASGVPITTAVTGGVPTFWNGPPVRFKVAIDQFLPVTAAAVAAGGSGYAVGDFITLVSGPTTSPPIGAPVVLQVATIGGGGSVATASVVNQIAGEASPQGGSYFASQANPIAQGSTTGSGSGATFNLTFGSSTVDQRVILTNEENAALCYIRQVTDPNVMDPMFLNAWSAIVGADLVMALVGDKTLANLMVKAANEAIVEARKVDGNEGLTVNDITPDFIRTRGIDFPIDMGWTPNMGFDWGALYPMY